MDAYPRETTWYHVLIVAILFMAAVIAPRWWRSLDSNEREAMLQRVDRAVSRLSPDSDSVAGGTDPWESPATGFTPAASDPRIADLRPPVSQRIVIEPNAELDEIDVGATDLESPLPERAGPGMSVAESDKTNRQPVKRNSTINATEFELHHVSSVLPEQPERRQQAEPVSEWPDPSRLLSQLNELCSAVKRVEQWRTVTIDLLIALQKTSTLADSRVPAILNHLSQVAAKSSEIELAVPEPERVIIRQIAYGIHRRVSVWQAVHALATRQYQPPVVNESDALPLLRAIDERLADREHGEQWRGYLMLERLRQVATSTWETDSSVRCAVAREVLLRMRNEDLSEQQQDFLRKDPLAGLASTLEQWAQTTVELPNLTQTIEQFETARSGQLASHIVRDLESLRWIEDADARRLQAELERHYRNANIRISVAGGLINDLLPVMKPIQEPVRDRIMGASVRGRNDTWTRLRVRLMNANDRIQLRFEAAGNTRSNTVSTKGPIRIYSRGNSVFRAGKGISLSRGGLQMQEATAIADGQSRLTSVESEYDNIPLLGWVVRQLAVDELQDNRDRMRREVSGRVSRAARERLDESLQDRVDNVERQLATSLIEPLRNLQLKPTALEMKSTANRMVMRCRIAADQQLAAYTPRPRALRDCVLSIQLHESSANNPLQQLELSGKHFELEELMGKLAGKLQLAPEDIAEELPRGVTVRLGHDRPIQVQFNDGRVLVTIRIAELTTPKRKWRSFVVRGRYRAGVDRMHVDLEREGGIELISERLAFRDQIALRGIFTKVMTKNHRLNVIRGRFEGDPRLADLEITQFVVRDGWIGISVGHQTGERVAKDATRS